MSDIDLLARARQVMEEEGFQPDFSAAVLAEARGATPRDAEPPRDLRDVLWSSVDNAESRDLDQLAWAEPLPGGQSRLWVAIADVDAYVPPGGPMDQHAGANTTSVYTGVRTFSMIPERLSTDLTSLHEGQDRRALVLKLLVDADGAVHATEVALALVRNQARLVYDEVGRWLEGAAPPPAKVAANPALEAQLRLQDELARALKRRRQQRGALELDTIEARPVSDGTRIVGLEVVRKSRARELIEDVMLAANAAMAELCEARDVSWIRRLVRSPERWERIVALAVERGEVLPAAPDGPALAAFLVRQRTKAPERFAELSLAVVKSMGPGEYAVERAGEDLGGHFGLAVGDYTHATAPNRRYADLVTQRLVKAVLAGAPPPYSDDELAAIAERCTRKEDSARVVERKLRKLAAAVLLRPRIGESFDAVVTGVSKKGTFARLLNPPAEGRVVVGEGGLDVGDRLRVKLVATDTERGFIDLAVA